SRSPSPSMLSVPPDLGVPPGLMPCTPLFKMLVPLLPVFPLFDVLLHAAAVRASAARLATAREVRVRVRIDASSSLSFVPQPVVTDPVRRLSAPRHDGTPLGRPSRHLRSSGITLRMGCTPRERNRDPTVTGLLSDRNGAERLRPTDDERARLRC